MFIKSFFNGNSGSFSGKTFKTKAIFRKFIKLAPSRTWTPIPTKPKWWLVEALDIDNYLRTAVSKVLINFCFLETSPWVRNERNFGQFDNMAQTTSTFWYSHDALWLFPCNEFMILSWFVFFGLLLNEKQNKGNKEIKEKLAEVWQSYAGVSFPHGSGGVVHRDTRLEMSLVFS